MQRQVRVRVYSAWADSRAEFAVAVAAAGRVWSAVELLLTGRIFSGADAIELGLATESLPGDEVLGRALQIAADIAATTAPAAVGVTKQLAYDLLGETDRESAFYREWETFRWFGRQTDAGEGVASFLERRAPEFKLSKHIPLPETDPGWSADE